MPRIENEFGFINPPDNIRRIAFASVIQSDHIHTKREILSFSGVRRATKMGDILANELESDKVRLVHFSQPIFASYAAVVASRMSKESIDDNLFVVVEGEIEKLFNTILSGFSEQRILPAAMKLLGSLLGDTKYLLEANKDYSYIFVFPEIYCKPLARALCILLKNGTDDHRAFRPGKTFGYGIISMDGRSTMIAT